MVWPGGSQNGTAAPAATATRPSVTDRRRPQAPIATAAYQACSAAASAGEGYTEVLATSEGTAVPLALSIPFCSVDNHVFATDVAPAAVTASRTAAVPVDTSATLGTTFTGSTVTAETSGSAPSIRLTGCSPSLAMSNHGSGVMNAINAAGSALTRSE